MCNYVDDIGGVQAAKARAEEAFMALGELLKDLGLQESVKKAVAPTGCLIAFFTLFRNANLCPRELKFDPETVLTRGDIILDREKERVLIYLSISPRQINTSANSTSSPFPRMMIQHWIFIHTCAIYFQE